MTKSIKQKASRFLKDVIIDGMFIAWTQKKLQICHKNANNLVEEIEYNPKDYK